MKEKIFIYGSIIVLILLLIGLSAASYVQKEKIPESEARPNRSTYNTGPTGTRAFHDLLASVGQSVVRWEKPISALNNEDNSVGTFVIVGRTRKELLDNEISQLLEWVEYGGRLVLVDRSPRVGLLENSTDWKISVSKNNQSITDAEMELLLPTVDPSNSTQMTSGEPAAKSVQPSLYSFDVNAAQPSKFATSIVFERPNVVVETRYGYEERPQVMTPPEEIEASNQIDEDAAPGTEIPSAESNSVIPAENIETVPAETVSGGFQDENVDEPPPPLVIQGPVDSNENYDADLDLMQPSPVVHFGNKTKNIVVDFPYGDGTIVVVSDPYLISNGGVRLVDNAQLVLNVVSDYGTVAFDEFHQGYGSNQNRLLTYFYGTPVIPVFLQLALIVGLIMLSLSQRFARPIPLKEASRVTKLEYVAAMAQLKKRTKAFDLAIENIYTDFRRRVSRLAGIDNHRSSNAELALAIEQRSEYKASDIELIMSRCEDVIHGQKTSSRVVLDLANKIREIEKALGLRRGRTIFRK